MLQNKYTLQVGLTTNTHKKFDFKTGFNIIKNIVNYYVPCATFTSCIGTWQNNLEQSIQIEIVSDLKIDFIIWSIIKDLKIELLQDCILYQKQIIDIDFI